MASCLSENVIIFYKVLNIINGNLNVILSMIRFKKLKKKITVNWINKQDSKKEKSSKNNNNFSGEL